MQREMEVARAALSALREAGAGYGDVRVNRLETERLGVRNGRLEEARQDESFGLGVRVLVNGSWGFVALPLADLELNHGALTEAAVQAVAMARALGRARRNPVHLAPLAGKSLEWATPCQIDPFAVPLEDKIALLMSAEHAMQGAAQTVIREASCDLRREQQWFVSTDGAEIFQNLVRTGAGISSTAAAHGEVQRRSYPGSFGGNYQSRGWEHVLELDLVAHAERVRDEAVALCEAELIEPGRHDLILGPGQLMLQIHESVGHPNELDRVFGHEVDLAGNSFATTDKLGSFRYGSEIVNLVADSTLAGGLDTRGADDDGVPSSCFHVVKDGILTGYHTNREWAAAIGEQASRGTNRAEGWFNPPIIRITNLSLEPGDWEFEDLIADTEDGVYCDTVKMWSIDQRRLNFQFTTEIGWKIENGERTRLVRNPTYQGQTPEFWRSCDAICNEKYWELFGVPNCGKGNPMQVAEMSHGCAPSRFRGVTFL